MIKKGYKKQIIAALVILYFIIIGTIFIKDYVRKNVTSSTQNEETSQTVEQTNKIDVIKSEYDTLTSDLSYDLSTAKMPILNSDCVSIISANKLPSLERMSAKDTAKYMSNIQVFKKIEDLGIDTKSFETPEFNWKNIYNEVCYEGDQKIIYSNKVAFNGTTASELNNLIQKSENTYITITSDNLILDETIRLKSGIGLNAEGVTFSAQGLDKAVLIENCNNVMVENFNLTDGGYAFGLYVVNSSNFTINACTLNSANTVGLVVLGENKNFKIVDNTMRYNGWSGIFLGGNVNSGIFEGNKVESNKGTSNFGAGIIMAAMKIQNYQTPYVPFVDNYLYDMGDAPHNLVFYRNVIQWNNSSGLYSCGSYMNYLVNNTFYRNDKEGMCLDYGTFGVYVSNNTVKENGGRYRQSDGDLEADFISSFGRLPDGSSPAKLPGISLDNAAYNILVNNDVDDNYGDGIKTVRSAFRNIIMSNIIGDNNIGQNDKFHFFAIDMGFASKPDEPVKGLDFIPPYENIICRNIITGNNFSGIHLSDGDYCNDVYDNVIMQAMNAAIECHSKMYNSIINNNVDNIIINDFVK